MGPWSGGLSRMTRSSAYMPPIRTSTFCAPKLLHCLAKSFGQLAFSIEAQSGGGVQEAREEDDAAEGLQDRATGRVEHVRPPARAPSQPCSPDAEGANLQPRERPQA